VNLPLRKARYCVGALKREKLTFRCCLGIYLGAVGVMMILLPKSTLPKIADTFFSLVAFAGAACYAAEHLYIEVRAPSNVGIDKLLFLMFLSASVLLLPVALATNSFFVPHWPFGMTEWAIVAIASVTLIDYYFITLFDPLGRTGLHQPSGIYCNLVRCGLGNSHSPRQSLALDMRIELHINVGADICQAAIS
jgi:hypothetical protein